MAETTTDRRTFYLSVVYGLSAIMGMALGIPALLYLFVPPRAKQGNEWVDAGDVSQLRPNVPEELQFRRRRVDGWRVVSEKTSAWVVQIPKEGLVAFSPQCTHLGCAYHWDDSKKVFVCPCHTSAFSINGKVLEGPAPRPLDRYAVKVDRGHILIGPLQKASNVA